MKDRYLIKATYTDGPHAGKCYLMRKGGYVTDIYSYQWDDTTYAGYGFADRVCKKNAEDDDFWFQWERREDEVRIKRRNPGKTENQFIHWHSAYVPIRVDPTTDQVDRAELTPEEIEYLESMAKW